MGNELVIPSNKLTREQIDLIKRTVAQGATDNELQLFLYQCEKRGLDPLTRQIHFVKRKQYNRDTGNYEETGTIQTGIDGYRLIAQRTGKLAGIKRGVIKDKDGHLTGAWAEVYRTDWKEPARDEVSLSEYCQRTKEGEPMRLWKTMPETMLKKVAEATVLRMAFPEDLSGIYTDDEMAQADRPETETKAEPITPGIMKKMQEAVNKAAETATKGTETSHTPQGTALPDKQAESITPQDGTLPAARIYKPETGHKPIRNYGDFLNDCFTELKPTLSPELALKKAKLTREEAMRLTPDQLEAKFQELNK